MICIAIFEKLLTTRHVTDTAVYASTTVFREAVYCRRTIDNAHVQMMRRSIKHRTGRMQSVIARNRRHNGVHREPNDVIKGLNLLPDCRLHRCSPYRQAGHLYHIFPCVAIVILSFPSEYDVITTCYRRCYGDDNASCRLMWLNGQATIHFVVLSCNCQTSRSTLRYSRHCDN